MEPKQVPELHIVFIQNPTCGSWRHFIVAPYKNLAFKHQNNQTLKLLALPVKLSPTLRSRIEGGSSSKLYLSWSENLFSSNFFLNCFYLWLQKNLDYRIINNTDN